MKKNNKKTVKKHIKKLKNLQNMTIVSEIK